MGKEKIPLILLVILFLICAGFAYKFYTQSQVLLEEKASLKEKTASLTEDNSSLKRKIDKLIEKRNQLTSQNEELTRQIDKYQEESEFFRNKYSALQQEREELTAQITKLKEQRKADIQVAQKKTVNQDNKAYSGTQPQQYWENVIQENAELKVKVSDLLSRIKDIGVEINNIQKQKASLEINMKAAEQEIESLRNQLVFKERAIKILTKDLVKEKKDKIDIKKEAEKIKSDNITLANEIKKVNDANQKLEETLRTTQKERDKLKVKIDNIDILLKRKALEISSLQEQLSSFVDSAESLPAVIPDKGGPGAVELPPIVVSQQPDASSNTAPLGKVQGRVLAVNTKEKFVIVDIGRRNGINTGDRLILVRDGKAVGSLDVIETRQDISACDITQINSPVKEGDIVRFLG